MNNSQTVFTVFFAIFWGLLGNVQPRWKPFQLPLFFDLKWARHRAILAIVVFDVFPLASYIWVLFGLNQSNDVQRVWNLLDFLFFAGRCILPAFAVFGFYRLWLAAIEIWPAYFYALSQKDLPEQFQQINTAALPIEPTLDLIGIKTVSNNGGKNLFCALIYLIVAFGSIAYFK